jgi:DoxX-like family
MFNATVVLSVLLALVFAGSGAGKLAGAAQSLKFRDQLDLSGSAWRGIGALEIAAVAGLVAGCAVHPLGVAAAAGGVALMTGAVVAHARKGLLGKDVVPAAAVLALAVATLVVRLTG